MYINGYCFNDAYFRAWMDQESFVDLEFAAFNCYGV